MRKNVLQCISRLLRFLIKANQHFCQSINDTTSLEVFSEFFFLGIGTLMVKA